MRRKEKHKGKTIKIMVTTFNNNKTCIIVPLSLDFCFWPLHCIKSCLATSSIRIYGTIGVCGDGFSFHVLHGVPQEVCRLLGNLSY